MKYFVNKLNEEVYYNSRESNCINDWIRMMWLLNCTDWKHRAVINLEISTFPDFLHKKQQVETGRGFFFSLSPVSVYATMTISQPKMGRVEISIQLWASL